MQPRVSETRPSNGRGRASTPHPRSPSSVAHEWVPLPSRSLTDIEKILQFTGSQIVPERAWQRRPCACASGFALHCICAPHVMKAAIHGMCGLHFSVFCRHAHALKSRADRSSACHVPCLGARIDRCQLPTQFPLPCSQPMAPFPRLPMAEPRRQRVSRRMSLTT